MVLVVSLLALSLALGLTVKKVGFWVYATLFVCAVAASVVLLTTSQPLS
jgi:hypothetical protein